MFILYNLVFLLVAILYLPVYLFRGKFHPGFSQRLGILPKDLKFDRPIWIHAVSVGEVMAVKGFLKALKNIYPDRQFVISTVTPSGNAVARGIAGINDAVIYLTLDLSFLLNWVLAKIKPVLFIIVETEIWPNLLHCLYRRSIPIILVNGRISNGSFRRYYRIRFFLKPILRKVSFFCVRSQLDAQRLITLGVSKEKIRVTGNMKFDLVIDRPAVDARAKLGLAPDEKLFLAGSTFPGEEELILGAYKQLSAKFSGLRLFLAPRHPERTGAIEKLILKAGFSPLRISRLSETTQQRNNATTIFILDTMGQLIYYYSAADIVFIGKSLCGRGGQNFLEPAALARPIIFGPAMSNFQEAADLFLYQKAALLVHHAQELTKQIEYLLVHPQEAEALGKRARQMLVENQGATQRNLELIKEFIVHSS